MGEYGTQMPDPSLGMFRVLTPQRQCNSRLIARFRSARFFADSLPRYQ
jgi:hypothetical protein